MTNPHVSPHVRVWSIVMSPLLEKKDCGRPSRPSPTVARRKCHRASHTLCPTVYVPSSTTGFESDEFVSLREVHHEARRCHRRESAIMEIFQNFVVPIQSRAHRRYSRASQVKSAVAEGAYPFSSGPIQTSLSSEGNFQRKKSPFTVHAAPVPRFRKSTSQTFARSFTVEVLL